MTPTLNPIRAWNRFWFAPTSARPLAAFRIAFGLIVLANLALLWPDAELWLSGAGYLRGTEAREIAGPLRWSPLQYVYDPIYVHVIIGLTALATVGFTLGLWTRVCGVLVYAGMLCIHHRNILTISGADALLMITCFWMMLAPCGKAFSLDALRHGRRDAEPLIVPWAQRMMQVQLCIVYFMTAFEKVRGESWANGTALYHVLSNREIARWTFGLTQNMALINFFTFSALLIEFALAFFLWFRPTRPWVALSGVALHIGIILTVNIPIFGELMMATYLLFLTPQELHTFSRVVLPWMWFKHEGAQGPPEAGVSAVRGPKGNRAARRELVNS